MKKTEEIIRNQCRTGVHPVDATPDGWVSSASRWAEDRWVLDSASARMRNSDCTMIWDKDLPERTTEALKTLAWSLLVSRVGGKPKALSGASKLCQHLRYLGRWMQYRGHIDFGSITQTAVRIYRKDLVEWLKTDEKGKPREIDIETNTVCNYLLPLQYAYEQGAHLAGRELPGIVVEPYAGTSAWAIAEEIVPEVEGFTPPIPDEVVLPIAHVAHRWLGKPAEDILAIQDICLKERAKGRSHLVTTRAIRKRLAEFVFQSCEPGEEPWHAPFAGSLMPYADRARGDESEEDEDGEDGGSEHFGIDLVRKLLCSLIAACVIVVRFQTGVRHGEIFSFEPGIGEDGLPKCVHMESSLSGAYDMFFVNGVVSKGWDHPTDTKWLLAGRVAGSTDTPDAVRALQILSMLGQPWREWATDEDARTSLLVQIGRKGLPRDPSLVLPLSSEGLAELMKDFIEDWVDLRHLDPTDERLTEYRRTRGRSVQSKQWRKTWANWMIRVDKRLLPAISQQFHHHSVLLTEEAYIGKDAMQLGLVQSAAMASAVRFMRRAMDGEPHVGGGMRKVAQHELDELRKTIAGLTGSERDYQIRTWLLERDVSIWFSPHGKCFMGLMPGDSRCHEAAGTADWSNQTPSFAHRTPQLCSGCRCFAVDEEDLPFWTERYVENRLIWNQAVSRHMETAYTVARERWTQSEIVLRSLGVDTSTIELKAA